MYQDLANTSIFSAAGVAYCQYAITRNGLPMGPSGSIAAGQARGMGAWIAIKQANSQSPDPRITPVTGNNGRFLHQYGFNPAELGNIDMNFGAFNMNVHAAMTGTEVDNIGEWNAVGVETDAPLNAVQACLILNVDAQDADALYDGQARWVNWFYPLINTSFKGVNIEEIAAATWNYLGIPTRSGKYPWGVAFTRERNKFTRAKAVPLTSRNPLTIDTYVHDGTPGAKTFTLENSPASDETGYVVKAWNNKADGTVEVVTPTNIDIATKAVTIPDISADNGDVIEVLYETFDLSFN